MGYDEDEEDYSDDLLKKFEMPPDVNQQRIVLQILDVGGNIEDVIFDIEEIYKYVKNVYEKCPERN